jgi:hypothetical protein
MSTELGPRRKEGPVNKPDGFKADYDAFEPRFKVLNDLVLVIFGIETHSGNSSALRDKLVKEFSKDYGPEVLEHAAIKKGFGPNSQVWFAYWKTQETYESWLESSSIEQLFGDPDLLAGDVGLWREYCRISLDHNETSYSRTTALTGIANLSDALEVTPHHGYWGSARDRMVAAAAGALGSRGKYNKFGPKESLGKRITVEAPHNTCLIKTTQDLSLANAEQQEIYYGNVEPALHAGLNFLRSNPLETGCIGMRFVEEVERDKNHAGRTVGIGYFQSLASLEEWTHDSETHSEIMNQFMAMVQQFEGQPGLSLWHEVTVFPTGWLKGDYVNCSPDGTLMQLTTLVP